MFFHMVLLVKPRYQSELQTDKIVALGISSNPTKVTFSQISLCICPQVLPLPKVIY